MQLASHKGHLCNSSQYYKRCLSHPRRIYFSQLPNLPLWLIYHVQSFVFCVYVYLYVCDLIVRWDNLFVFQSTYIRLSNNVIKDYYYLFVSMFVSIVIKTALHQSSVAVCMRGLDVFAQFELPLFLNCSCYKVTFNSTA